VKAAEKGANDNTVDETFLTLPELRSLGRHRLSPRHARLEGLKDGSEGIVIRGVQQYRRKPGTQS
jgi:hypothetical protein